MSQLELCVTAPAPAAMVHEQEEPLTPSLALVGGSKAAPDATTMRRRGERGLVSAEWAMAIIAAVAIVGVLVGLLQSDAVRNVIMKVIKAIISAAMTQI